MEQTKYVTFFFKDINFFISKRYFKEENIEKKFEWTQKTKKL